MRLPKYNFYVAKRVRYMYLTRGVGINSSGEMVSLGQTGRWSSSITALPSGSHVVVTIACTTSYSAVFFYDSNRVFISSRLFINQRNSVITPPNGAAYYAVTFSNADISSVYKGSSSGEEVSFVYLAQAVVPHYKELNKKYAKENEQEFFRTSLDGKIALFGHDYEHIYGSDIEDQFLFLIEKYEPATDDTPENWSGYFRGEFSKTDCKFDYERKRCELSLSPKDEYADVLAKYEDTHDLIKLAPKISHINLHKRSLMQIYISGANSISNFFGGTYWEGEVVEAIDNHDALVNTYHFANIANANEFYVEGTGDSSIDGVYAGLNGVWYNNKGYEATWQRTRVQQSNVYTYWLIIRKTGTTTILYKSERYQYIEENTNDLSSSIYLTSGNTVPMVDATAASGEVVFTIQTIFAYRVYRRLLCDVASIEDSEGTKTLYDLPSDDFATDNRNYKKCIGFGGGKVYCTSEVTSTPTKYGINDSGKYFTNQFLPLSFGSARPLPICRSTWANASVWFAYDSYYEVWEPQLRKLYTLKDNYSIADVIKALLSQIDPTLKHEATAEYSQFLYGSTNPIGPNRFYVYLTQKSNVLKGDYDQPAQKAEAKLADIMGMLRDCFRCYWFIEDGKFKIEHVWFFINGGSYSASPGIQLDFTSTVDQFSKKPLAYFQSGIEYDKSDLARRYEFNWMDDATELFGGVTLDAQSSYVQKNKIENITPDQFSSDVDYMLFNPSAFSDDGFALLCPIKNGDAYELPILTATLLDENGQSYQAIAQNWYASWAYLTRTFYTRDMPARLIKSNVSGDFAASVKMCMTHSIEFTSEQDVNTLKLIKTNLGNGKVEEFSVNLDTQQVKVKLVYVPK